MTPMQYPTPIEGFPLAPPRADGYVPTYRTNVDAYAASNRLERRPDGTPIVPTKPEPRAPRTPRTMRSRSRRWAY